MCGWYGRLYKKTTIGCINHKCRLGSNYQPSKISESEWERKEQKDLNHLCRYIKWSKVWITASVEHHLSSIAPSLYLVRTYIRECVYNDNRRRYENRKKYLEEDCCFPNCENIIRTLQCVYYKVNCCTVKLSLSSYMKMKIASQHRSCTFYNFKACT